MQKTTPDLIADMETRAAEQGRDLEVLFHPISVPIEQCLDPENLPFAQACASPNRDAEAELIASLSTHAQGKHLAERQTAGLKRRGPRE